MKTTSILAKPRIKAWLKQAKRFLLEDDHLASVLFVKTIDGQVGMLGLNAINEAHNSRQKQLLMYQAGKKIRAEWGEISEALIILEGWYVDGKELNAGTMLPSQHPRRQEGICIVGRNAENTRVSSLIQPFTRDENHRPVWSKIPMAVYDEPVENNPTPVGLLDYLFTCPPGVN